MGTEKIIPVILAGGTGTRLWPDSRRLLPKQLRPLLQDETLLGHTLQYVADSGRFEPPVVVCGEDICFQVRDLLCDSGFQDFEVVTEPDAQGTAAAICTAMLRISASRPSDVVLILPGDTVFRRPAAFFAALDRAIPAARQGWLAVLAETAAPYHPGNLYIELGKALPGLGRCTRARGFGAAPADRGAPVLWRDCVVAETGALLQFYETASPALLTARRDKPAHRKRRDAPPPNDAANQEMGPTPDFGALLQAHIDRVAIVGADMGWTDIDTWSQVWDLASKDKHGNAVAGEVVAIDTHGCLLRSDGRLLATLGLADMAVVVNDDSVLVCPRERAAEVGTVVEELARGGHDVTDLHTRVYRPWGSYKRVHAGGGYQVKELTVLPGSVLSLQRHRYRAEHWVVVSGTAEVTCEDRVFRLQPNESTYVPLGALHRLANPGPDTLRVIEVQHGSYLGEDDIERFEDIYGRVSDA